MGSDGLTITLQSVSGAGFFVSKRMYGNRSKNFLTNSTFVAERDVRLITGLDLDEKSIFEFKLKPGMALPNSLGLYFTNYKRKRNVCKLYL